MLGTLLWTGCEKTSKEKIQTLELWSFPDGTLNLVANHGGPVEDEHTFPICIEQLDGVLRGRVLTLRSDDDVRLTVEHTHHRVCADYRSGDETWKHCVPVDEFRDVVEDIKARTAYVS